MKRYIFREDETKTLRTVIIIMALACFLLMICITSIYAVNKLADKKTKELEATKVFEGYLTELIRDAFKDVEGNVQITLAEKAENVRVYYVESLENKRLYRGHMIISDDKTKATFIVEAIYEQKTFEEV